MQCESEIKISDYLHLLRVMREIKETELEIDNKYKFQCSMTKGKNPQRCNWQICVNLHQKKMTIKQNTV